MAREIGISNIHLFELVTNADNPNDLRYRPAKKLPYAVSLETEIENATGEYYSDNVIENSINKVSRMNVTLEVSSATKLSLDGEITGKLITNGKVCSQAVTNTKSYAIAYEIKMDNGNTRKRIIYNVNLARTGQSNATQEDSIEGQTFTYEGVAAPLVCNNDIDMIMDEETVKNLADGPTTDQFDKFFNFVILKEDIVDTSDPSIAGRIEPAPLP